MHYKLLHLLYVQHAQALQLPLDYECREAFCKWLLQQNAAYPTFFCQVLLMDEASFTQNLILNTHNQHMWADENPHSFQETLFQQQFAVNVWVGIIGNLLLGPYELPP
jgi:hypothetical protein